MSIKRKGWTRSKVIRLLADSIRMLFDFYERENGKKKGSVHAMYMVAGRKRLTGSAPANGNSQTNGHTDVNPSSPILSSSMPHPEEEIHIPVKSITLVREEDLEGMFSRFQDQCCETFH